MCVQLNYLLTIAEGFTRR